MNTEQRAFHRWRTRARNRMPEIAGRVFDLRKRFYSGCGFHYSMEHDLGRVIALLNDFTRDFDLPAQITAEVLCSELFRRVKEAEESAAALAVAS